MADNLRSSRRRNQSTAASVSGESVVDKESTSKSKPLSRGRGRRASKGGSCTSAPSQAQPIIKKRSLDDDAKQQQQSNAESTTIDNFTEYKTNDELRDADEDEDNKSKQNESINSNNVKRSSRLRKSSNKYSNFEVSNVGPIKRKSTSELSVESKPVVGTKRTRRSKIEDESQHEEDIKVEITNEDTASNTDETLSIKELKKIEKKLLKEKKEIEEQLVKGENEEPVTVVTETPKSPIKIKISKSPNETTGGFKVNLGELVRNCKSKLGLLSSSRKNSSESSDKSAENEMKNKVDDEAKEESNELIIVDEEEKNKALEATKALEAKTVEINNSEPKETESKCVEDKSAISNNSPGAGKRSVEELKKIFEIKELKNKKLIEEIRSSYEQLIREIKYNNGNFVIYQSINLSHDIHHFFFLLINVTCPNSDLKLI